MKTKAPRNARKRIDDENDEDDNSDDVPQYIKLAVAGESGVGKTSLLSRFVNDGIEESTKTTIGVDYLNIWLKSNHPEYNRRTHLQLIDTAGQERFNGIVSAMFSNIPGVFLVFDVTRQETFQRLCEVWRPMVARRSERALCMLVASKCDLYTSPGWMDEIDMHEQARLLGCEGGFHAVSSLNGRHVCAMIVQMVDLAIAKEKELFDRVNKGVVTIGANKRKHDSCQC